jgi:hypothetical protein
MRVIGRGCLRITDPDIIQKILDHIEAHHHRLNLRQLFNPKTCLDEQAKITPAPPLNLLSNQPNSL